MRTLTMKLRLSVVALAALLSIIAAGQKLPESRRTSYYTYIYKITDSEARQIFSNNVWKVDSTFFHTLVDHYPTDSTYDRHLDEGHYLMTFSEKNRQMFSVTSVHNFEVFIYNNSSDLNLQVYDLQGNIIDNADVRVGSKKLRYDSGTMSYSDRKSNRRGLLQVTYNGFTAYYNLSRAYNNSFIRRGTRKVLYGTPVRYVWMPVVFTVRLPYDGVMSVVKGWPRGTVYSVKRFFINTFNRVADLFDGYTDNLNGKYTGYMVFNKPRYLPGDTVKLKAFIVSVKGKPLNKAVNVIIQTPQKRMKLTSLSPSAPGAYNYEFFLHDSLQLKLDMRYSVYLEKSDYEDYISSSFKYEDYELSKTRLSIRTDKTEQYRGQGLSFFVRGTDENDLNLQDARIEVLVKPEPAEKYFEANVFIPDTLLFIKKNLNPSGETEIVLPDTLFPAANFGYEISARMITSDNESVTESCSVNYFHHREKISISPSGDSLLVKYQVNGVSEAHDISVEAIDNFDNSTMIFSGKAPCSIALNPFYAGYVARSGDIRESYEPSPEESLLECYSERTGDSLTILIDNPRKLPFTYFLYRRNSEQCSGHTDSLNLRLPNTTKKNYYLSVSYMWGGSMCQKSYSIPLADKKLNIAVKQPAIVYPGQKAMIEVSVTDYKGRPVSGVDLTAMSMTGKFSYSPPQLPYLGKARKNKNAINNFSFKDISLEDHPGLQLNYETWKLLAGIDSIEYYRFIYPERSIYRSEHPTSDSVTQFAPFVVHNGAIQPVHIIWIDNRPVYFSWSTFTQPYSFRVTPGYHQIRLRTGDRNIVIDSMFFNPTQKLIFSMDRDLDTLNIHSEEARAELSRSEKTILYRYIFPYRNNFGESFAYLEQNGEIQFLKPSGYINGYYFAGPVSGKVTFSIIDGYTTMFDHEPGFEYEFAPGLLKMRTFDKDAYPQYLSYRTNEPSLSDAVLTKEALYDRWQRYLDSKRQQTPRYNYALASSRGAGSLLFELRASAGEKKKTPLNVLVFRHDNPDFLRVYPGNIKVIYDLRPGYYRLVFFYPNSEYHTADSLNIKPDGVNYFSINQPEALLKDSFSMSVTDLIETTLFGPVRQAGEEKKIRQVYRQSQYSGDGTYVEGTVFAADDGMPLPGVVVMVKGTEYGVVTDIDGHYRLKLPSWKNTLVFSFIGCKSKEIEALSDNIDVTLESEALMLQETVVIAYGVSRKSYLTGAATTISSNELLKARPSDTINALQGKVAGVQITGTPGGSVNIMIRGASAMSFDRPPLYIINGKVYLGRIDGIDQSLIRNIEILKADKATALYGSQAANGVVVITTAEAMFGGLAEPADKGAGYDDAFYDAAMKSGAIREKFSDYAFWKPTLMTDREGKAVFEVTFPDDVTNWRTYYLAMNGNRQSGQTAGEIKSYKPLMAQLAVPRFLVSSDTANIIGKTLNYSPDSVSLTRRFEADGVTLMMRDGYCVNSVIDTITVTAPADSITMKYVIEKEDGYFDGEARKIPVFAAGLEKAEGSFYVLTSDTTINMSFENVPVESTVYARADVLDVIEGEIYSLKGYRFMCNEQTASKLKALLAEKLIAQYRSRPFDGDRQIEKLIRILERNRKENGLWGWWKESDMSPWISLHVLEALAEAEKMGFKTDIDRIKIAQMLTWELETCKVNSERVRMLTILKMLSAPVDYKRYITDIEKQPDRSLNMLLRITELKQLCNLEYDSDTLNTFRKETIFGNIYYSKESTLFDMQENDIQNTLLAYRILRRDSTVSRETLAKIRNYIFETRSDGRCWNTYESASIIETIVPDLLTRADSVRMPVLNISGDINLTVTKFPFELRVAPGTSLQISKSGTFPVYLTNYHRYFDKSPVSVKGDFEVETSFSGEAGSMLTAGQPVTLTATVRVKKDADYVMINIPIPAGCSYADKKNNFSYESHREYFRNETAIFCDHLDNGTYTFEISLMPRFTGIYTLNPAKAELMYFPTFSANNEIRKVKIR